jgi:hypothetical protein
MYTVLFSIQDDFSIIYQFSAEIFHLSILIAESKKKAHFHASSHGVASLNFSTL